jgi:transmembrane sensor
MKSKLMDENYIVKYLQNSLSSEEQEEFKNWLLADPKNNKLFKDFKKVWVLTSELSSADCLDPEHEFEQFKKEHLKSIKANTSGLKRRLIPILRIAAVVLITVGTTVLVQKLSQRNVPRVENSFNQILTKAGEKTHLVLSDGSNIWLNVCSMLKYPTDLNRSEIDIYLDGEAYFDLKKIPGRKFIIHTSKINIKVLGTAFNLKSYPDENTIETTLIRGKISISQDGQEEKAQNEVILSPNQSAIFFKSADSIYKPDISGSFAQKSSNNLNKDRMLISEQKDMVVQELQDPTVMSSWKDGKLIFKAEPFEQLAKRLERRYNVKINITSEKLKNSRLSGMFDNESIEQALKALSYPVQFSFDIQKDSITISPH